MEEKYLFEIGEKVKFKCVHPTQGGGFWDYDFIIESRTINPKSVYSHWKEGLVYGNPEYVLRFDSHNGSILYKPVYELQLLTLNPR